jgi:radical SAM-linked protein
MKLYFMIGLPTEEDEDVRGIVETAARVQEIGARYFRGAKVTASVSTHVPKPHTPFQWAAMDGEEETARKQGLLAAHARALRVDLKMHENHQSHLEGIFSRGDRACADLLERAYRLGCRFDGWDEALRMDLWDQAIDEERARGFTPERYLGTLPVSGRVPWDHLDMGLEDGFLAREYRLALKGRLSPPCGKPYKQLLHHTNVAAAEAGARQKLVCFDCGIACDLDGMKKERLYFLRRMNAWTPPAVVAAPARASQGAVGKGRHKMQPPTRLAQGAGRRYRLRYTKLGRIAYLGHLDLIRHLPRIFRRAGLELFYSVGFHPKPELSFGPALGLGIPSLGELIDVTLVEDVEPGELLRRLNAVSLEGVEFLGAATLGANDRGLGRAVGRASYVACVPDQASATRALVAYAEGGPLMVVRQSDRGPGKGIGKRVDVRSALTDLGVPDAGTAARVHEVFGWPADRVIAFGLAVRAEGSARPVEVWEALLGPGLAGQVDIARVALSAVGAEEEGGAPPLDPLDTAALRAAALVAARLRAAAAGDEAAPPPG